MATEVETVEYDIKLMAQGALIQLAELTASTASFKTKMKEAQLAVDSFATRTGMAKPEVKALFKTLDEGFAEAKGASVVFGGAGSAAWDRVGEASTKNTNKMLGNFNALRIAAGILVSVLIRNVLQAFQQLVSGAVNSLRELELSTYNLINAERRLSEQGVEITPKDLDSFIAKLQKLDPLLSKIQASQLVAGLATKVAPALGLTKDEMESLGQSLVVLSIRNKQFGKTTEEVFQEGYNALLSGRISKGLNDLGLKLNDQIVKENAINMGLVETADAYDKLEGKLKAQIAAKSIINLLEQNTNKELSHLPEYFKTADANFGIFQARFSDVLTKFGTLFAPVIIKLFETLSTELEKVSGWLDKNKDSLSSLAQIGAKAVPIFIKLLEFVLKFATTIGYAFIKAIEGIQRFIDKIPVLKKAIELIAGKTTPDIGNAPDTPTGRGGIFGYDAETQSQEKAAKEHEEKLTDIMRDARDKRLDIERNYQEKLQDIALNYSQKLEDIARKQAQSESDAQLDYSKKVTDINRDAEEKEADARQEANQRAIDIEKDHQDKLKKLREKYLMDLEEALHDRDARQILHLMRQYELDKKNAQEERAKDQKQSKEKLQKQLRDIEQSRKLKLEEAKRDLEDKLRSIRLSAARERQDAQINYNRQLADARIAHQRALEEQRIYLQRKLRDLAEALAKEYGLIKSGLTAINSLYSSIGSPIGSSTSPASINAGTYTPPTNTGFAGSGMYGTGGLAEGGSYLARTPHSINVAENGPELIRATPINRIGKDINKLFMQAGSGGSSTMGQMEIGITLSPDLEARVIRKALNDTAEVILKVNRSKV